jgi:hypothetical protein
MLIESFVNHSTVRSRHSSIPPLNNRALEGEGIRMCYWMNEIQSSEPRSYPAMSSSESMPLLGPDVNTVRSKRHDRARTAPLCEHSRPNTELVSIICSSCDIATVRHKAKVVMEHHERL